MSAILEDVADLLDQAQAIVDKAEAEDRNLTADEQKRIDELLKTTDKAHRMVDQHQGQGRKSEPNQPGARPAAADVDVRNTPGIINTHRPLSGPEARQFRAMFGDRVANDRGGFQDAADFFKAVLGGRPDPRLHRVSIHDVATESSGPAGGFSVPPAFLRAILDPSLDDEVVRPRCRVHPMTGPALPISTPDMGDHSSSIAGFSATWVGENTDPGGQTPKWRMQTLTARKIFIRGEASNELLADSPSALDDIMVGLRGAASFGLDGAFIAGSGAGQPLGILNTAGHAVVAKKAGQAADTIVWENLSAAFAKLHPGGHRRAIWLAHPTTLPELLRVHVPVENIGRTDYVGGSPVLTGNAASDTLTATAVAGGAFTTLTTSSKTLLYVLEVSAADLDSGFRAVRLSLGAAGNTVVGVVAIRYTRRHLPAA